MRTGGEDSGPGLTPGMYRVAAEWHERLDGHGASSAVQARFRKWLDADRRHARAYEAVDAGWDVLGTAAADPRIQAMRDEAMAAVLPRRARRRVAIAMAASIAAAVAAGGWLLPSWPSGPEPAPIAGREYHTALGQRSSVALADGSSVELNTDSRIVVDYAPQTRRILLLRGQAWFDVETDPQRPFVVEAGGQRITALGTAFDVRLDDAHADDGRRMVQVTLMEGRVAVQAIPGPIAAMIRPAPSLTELAPGEQLRVGVGTAAEKREADLAKVTGWREGQLMFEGDTLASAVAEVNRYSTVRIELGDPALAELPVSGVFKTGHVRSFLETVSGHYAIRVIEEEPERVLLVRGR